MNRWWKLRDVAAFCAIIGLLFGWANTGFRMAYRLEVVEAFAEDQKQNIRQHVADTKEIEHLTRAFNDFKTRFSNLEQAIEEERKYQRGVNDRLLRGIYSR